MSTHDFSYQIKTTKVVTYNLAFIFEDSVFSFLKTKDNFWTAQNGFSVQVLPPSVAEKDDTIDLTAFCLPGWSYCLTSNLVRLPEVNPGESIVFANVAEETFTRWREAISELSDCVDALGKKMAPYKETQWMDAKGNLIEAPLWGRPSIRISFEKKESEKFTELQLRLSEDAWEWLASNPYSENYARFRATKCDPGRFGFEKVGGIYQMCFVKNAGNRNVVLKIDQSSLLSSSCTGQEYVILESFRRMKKACDAYNVTRNNKEKEEKWIAL
jgi:hypothetical protein